MAKISVPWSKIQGVLGDVTRGVGDNTTVTLVSPSADDAIADKPWEGPAEGGSAETYSDIPAVRTMNIQTQREDVGTDLAMTRGRWVIAGGDLSVEPQLGWTITDNAVGQTLSVTKVKVVRASDVTLAYVIDGAR